MPEAIDYDARCTNCQREVIVQLHTGADGEPGYFTSDINFCPHCGNLLQYDVMGLHSDSLPGQGSGQGEPDSVPTSQFPADTPAPPEPQPIVEAPANPPDWLPQSEPTPAPVEDVPAPDDPLWGGNPLWGGGTPDDEELIYISRGALRTALAHGLDASTLTGSGPNGAITLQDVLTSFPLG